MTTLELVARAEAETPQALPTYLWTRTEAATILRCGLTKVTRLLSSGELLSVKILGQRLVPDEDLRAYIAAKRAEALLELRQTAA